MTDIINYDNNDKLQYKPNDESKDKVEEKLDDKMKKTTRPDTRQEKNSTILTNTSKTDPKN